MKRNSFSSGDRKRGWKIFRNIILAVAGIWAVILIVLQIALTPGVLTGMANRAASRMVDGYVSFGKVRASVFRHFPYLSVTFDSLAVTYPADRFEAYGAGQDWYTSQGRGGTCDTLMSFDRLSAALNLSSLIAGQINIPQIILSKPRIYATSYNDSTASWNILKFMGTAEEKSDTVSSGLPDLVIGRIRLEDRPRIIFSSIPDSTNLSLSLRKMIFFGRIETKDIRNSRLGLRVDTLFMTGRFPADTIAARLDHFVLRGKDHGINMKALATAYMATGTYGRMKLPVEIIPCPVVREESGLAMSSRNTLLTDEERRTAANIYQVLKKSKLFAANHSLADTYHYVVDTLNSVIGLEVQYFSIVNGDTLQEVGRWDEADYIVGCITVFCGAAPIRLIDHIRYKG